MMSYMNETVIFGDVLQKYKEANIKMLIKNQIPWKLIFLWKYFAISDTETGVFSNDTWTAAF